MDFRKDKQYLITVLSALLHDVGKLGWRSEGSSSKHRHEYFSKAFVQQIKSNPRIDEGNDLDLKSVSEIVYNHHSSEFDRKEISPENKIPLSVVNEADHRSSMMEREECQEESPEDPLESIFNRVCICDKPSKMDGSASEHNKNMAYLPSVYSLESIFPVARDDLSLDRLRSESKRLWEDLIEESNNLPKEVGAFINSTHFLLKKYVSFTLSAGYRSRPCVPLFDHLKSTAAIASSIYQYSKIRAVSPTGLKESPFTVIIGDMSGIQNFIFNTFSHEESRKNTAKRLRGRSIEISLIMDAAAHMFLEELELFEFNLLWCTGGQFAILAPKTPLELIDGIAKEINKELWRRYGEQLYLAISASDCPLSSKEDLGSVLKRCSDILNEKKARKFIEFLCEEKYFVSAVGFEPRGRCHACGKDLVRVDDENDGFCASCREQEEIGQKSVKMDFLLRSRNAPKPDFSFGGFEYQFLEERDVSGIEEGSIYSINRIDFLKPKAGDRVSRGFMFIGNTVPTFNREVISFDHLSKMSKGSDKLGLAKGDVDNLGQIMHSGIDPVMIWSTSTLSSMLDAFFSGYLNKIFERYYTYQVCESCYSALSNAGTKSKGCTVDVEAEDEQGNKTLRRYVKWWLLKEGHSEIEAKLCDKCKSTRTPIIYTNYAGGDDFLIIGPWDAVIEASIEIRDEFRRLTSDNPDAGMSIGIVLSDPKAPISITASQLASKLSYAKEYRSSLGQNTFKKDMAALLGDVAFLSEKDAKGNGSRTLSELMGLARELEADVERDSVPRGLIHDLITLWRGAFEYRSGGRDAGSAVNLEKARREVRSYMPFLKYKLKRNLSKDSMQKYDQILTETMPWMLIPASWVSLRTRTRRG